MNDDFESVDYGKMRVGMTIDEINKRCEKARKEGARQELKFLLNYYDEIKDKGMTNPIVWMKAKMKDRLKELK